MQETSKLLTISIASYNVEEFLSRTVGSVILPDEFMKFLDIVIVNDGSKDGTLSVASKLAANYPDSIRVIDKPNGGYGSTVNDGLYSAKGKYFKLLDGDDEFNTENLTLLLKYLMHAEADLIITPWVIMKEGSDSREIARKHTELSTECIDMEEASFGDGIAMFEVCIRTSLMRELGVRISEHCFYTDNEVVMGALMCARTVAMFDKPLYCYRLGVEGQSVSIEGQRKHFRDYPKAFKGALNIYEEGRKALDGNIKGGRKFATDMLISMLMRGTYIAYMLQERPLSYRAELMAFDSFIKREYSELYELTGRTKVVGYARKAGPLGYRILCRLVYRMELKRTR